MSVGLVYVYVALRHCTRTRKFFPLWRFYKLSSRIFLLIYCVRFDGANVSVSLWWLLFIWFHVFGNLSLV